MSAVARSGLDWPIGNALPKFVSGNAMWVKSEKHWMVQFQLEKMQEIEQVPCTFIERTGDKAS
jgi:hypothetical protein